MSSVTVVGLGIIGSIWAGHYKDAGHEVRAWNRTPHPENPLFEKNLSIAVKGSELVHVCVADPSAAEAVLQEIVPALTKGALVVQSSTISPSAAKSFSQKVRGAGMAYVEAPFTGSKPAAADRQVVFFTGGEAGEKERARPFLEILSRKIFSFSTVEKAAAIKLAMNLQIAAISQCLTEGYHLAGRHGLSGEEFFSVLEYNVAHSGLADLKREKLLHRDYAPQFSIKHMAKDLRLAMESAEGLELSLTERTSDIYKKGLAAGAGDLDFIALEKFVRELSKED